MLDEVDLNNIKSLLTTQLKPIKKDIQAIKKNVNTLIGYFDQEDLKLEKRIETIETRLGSNLS